MEENINSLVVIEQMPVLMYKLEEIGKQIDEALTGIDTMECTEENKLEVKKRRTEVNNLSKIMEDKRKEIKTKILEPYEIFNEKYETEIKSKLTYASEILKEKIDEIENGQKNAKIEELKRFTNEYIENLHLEGIVDYEKLNLNVTLSASEKSLKTSIIGQLEDIAKYVQMIKLEEYADEIMVEFKENLDFVKSKLTVIERHQKMLQMQEQRQQEEEKVQQEEKMAEQVQEIIAPVEVIDDDEEIMVTITITGKKSQIREIKQFIDNSGVKYE